LASMPVTQNSAKARLMFVRIVRLSSAVCAITGIITFSSSWPADAAKAIVVSLPTIRKHTIERHSAMTGFTLPGMIELPG
jgi:hypothetical protein